MHNVLIGGTVFAAVCRDLFLVPEDVRPAPRSERLGKLHFWAWPIGVTLTFVPQYQLGRRGHASTLSPTTRRNPGWAELNLLSTPARSCCCSGSLPFLVAVIGALRRPAGRARRPVAGELARVGDVVAAAPPQLPVAAAHPVGAARIRRPHGGAARWGHATERTTNAGCRLGEPDRDRSARNSLLRGHRTRTASGSGSCTGF